MGSQCLESLVLFEKEESFYHLLGAFLKEPGSPCQEVPQINGLLTAPWWGGTSNTPERNRIWEAIQCGNFPGGRLAWLLCRQGTSGACVRATRIHQRAAERQLL